MDISKLTQNRQYMQKEDVSCQAQKFKNQRYNKSPPSYKATKWRGGQVLLCNFLECNHCHSDLHISEDVFRFLYVELE